MAIHKSGEDYLETILLLERKISYVRSIDIASEMGFSKPSVSRAVKILKSDGLIDIAQDGEITLTEKGREIAEEIYDRHTTLTCFLTGVLGVSAATAQEDACKIEHELSMETFKKLKRFIKRYEKNNRKEEENGTRKGN